MRQMVLVLKILLKSPPRADMLPPLTPTEGNLIEQ